MNLGSFGTLLPFFRTSWCVGVLNSAIFNSFHNRVEFGTILAGLQNFGGGLNTRTPPRYATALPPTCRMLWNWVLIAVITHLQHLVLQAAVQFRLFLCLADRRRQQALSVRLQHVTCRRHWRQFPNIAYTLLHQYGSIGTDLDVSSTGSNIRDASS